MFELMVMPLRTLWSDDDEAAADAVLAQLRGILSEAFKKDVSWVDGPMDAADEDVFGVDPEFLYALRAAAAWLEFHANLDGFDAGEEPWSHPIFERLEQQGQANRFPQLLHSDNAEVTAFIPVDLDDVLLIEDEDSTEHGLSIGSLPRLMAELEEIRPILGLEAGVEVNIEDVVFDPEVDSKAGPRFGWLLLANRLAEANKRALPLVIALEQESDDEEEEDSAGEPKLD